MRLTVHLLGVEVFDIAINEPVADEVELDPRGDVLSTPIGFTRVGVPWEDPGSYHQFDPEPDGEDA